MTKIESKVIDSWAIVAWVQDEPGASAFETFLQAAESAETTLYMSAINLGEAFYIIAKRRSLTLAEQFLERLSSFPIHVLVPQEGEILAAARIKAEHAVSYGDAFAIALAQTRNASVITGDREIQRCGLVAVDWIGNRIH